jgi:hypothetical protein
VHSKLPRYLLLGLGCAVCLLVAWLPMGCGKGSPTPPAKVSGVVQFQGRPLWDGLVVFTPDTDRGSFGPMLSATIDRNGQFVLADGEAKVQPGWYRVAISDAASGSAASTFPTRLRRPDRSGLERQILPGQDHHFEFLIELTR